MIKLLRVDHRLLHGQVAMTWTKILGIDCILVANDKVAGDNICKTTLKLAKPDGVKLVIKNMEDSVKALNSGVTDTYKLLILAESIEDAYRLASECREVTSVNLGGCKPREEAVKVLGKAVSVTDREEQMLRQLAERGIEVEIRQVPGDRKILVGKDQ